MNNEHLDPRASPILWWPLALAPLICITATICAGLPEELPADLHHRSAKPNTALDPLCDFDTNTCKVSEDQLLEFDIFASATPGLPLCLFADPQTLPPGAVFPPIAATHAGTLFTTFSWTPHECQAGEHIVHFYASFFCFDFFFGTLRPITITVNDAEPCEEFGACCKPDGTCQELTREECHQIDGSFGGEGTLCNVIAGPTVCEVTLGACCEPTGHCTQTTADDCYTRRGEYLGPGSACESGKDSRKAQEVAIMDMITITCPRCGYTERYAHPDSVRERKECPGCVTEELIGRGLMYWVVEMIEERRYENAARRPSFDLEDGANNEEGAKRCERPFMQRDRGLRSCRTDTEASCLKSSCNPAQTRSFATPSMKPGPSRAKGFDRSNLLFGFRDPMRRGSRPFNCCR